MTKLQKQMFMSIENSAAVSCASDWAFGETSFPFTNAKFNARVYAVIDLAKSNLITDCDSLYHAKSVQCLACEVKNAK